MKIYKLRWLPISKRMVAITLPPAGIFIKRDWWEGVSEERQKRLIRHEMTHWRQYQNRNVFSYYVGYLILWMQYGYDEHPWEREAREAAR